MVSEFVFIFAVVLHVVPILFTVGDWGILPILLSCIGTDMHDPNLFFSLSFFMSPPPTLPQLESKQTEGHSALVILPTTLSNSGIDKKFRKVPSVATVFSQITFPLTLCLLKRFFPVLLNNHSMNLKILNNQHHMLVVCGLWLRILLGKCL